MSVAVLSREMEKPEGICFDRKLGSNYQLYITGQVA